jgi:hypothetical protein
MGSTPTYNKNKIVSHTCPLRSANPRLQHPLSYAPRQSLPAYPGPRRLSIMPTLSSSIWSCHQHPPSIHPSIHPSTLSCPPQRPQPSTPHFPLPSQHPAREVVCPRYPEPPPISRSESSCPTYTNSTAANDTRSVYGYAATIAVATPQYTSVLQSSLSVPASRLVSGVPAALLR